MDDFYAARSSTMPPLTWTNFAPPFSRDLAYLAENGLLRLSIRLFGVHIERGDYEEDARGDWFSVPMERTCFTGFQDLKERDVFRLFRMASLIVV